MKDLTDQIINGFKVLGLHHKQDNKIFWSVICTCGKERNPMRGDSILKHTGKCTCKPKKGDVVNGYTFTGLTRKVPSGVERQVYHCCGDVRYLKIADLKRLKSTSCPVCRNSYTVKGEVVTMDVSTKTHPNMYTTFDLKDLPLILEHKWYVVKFSSGYPYYVQCDSGGYKTQIHIHILKSVGRIVDHVDGNGLNNKRCNLRLTNSQGNSRNMTRHSHNTTGHMGVSKTKNNGYISYIIVSGKQIHLGYYDTFEGAVKARKDAEMLYGFHENHGRCPVDYTKGEQK